MHYIYCLTNIVNNKKYIGRTNNIVRRMTQHKNDSVNSSCKNKFVTPLAKAIQKYGWDNFKLDILAENRDPEVINKLEQDYIKKYNTYGKDGYNASIGGEFGYSGRVYKRQLSEEQISQLIQDLKNNLSQKVIGEKYGLSAKYISDINRGYRLRRENESYPIQVNRSSQIGRLCPKIVEDLELTTMSIKKIAEKYGVSVDTIQRINKGNNKFIKTLRNDFPIRKN